VEPDDRIAEHLADLEANDMGLGRRPRAELIAIVQKLRAAVVAKRAR
jgi:hypothetical protein